jgi:hypothetical protein
MALLQKFQADIEDINKKNIEEQRAAIAIALQQEKERKDPKSKQALAQEPTSKEVTPLDSATDIEALLDIQVCLFATLAYIGLTRYRLSSSLRARATIRKRVTRSPLR